MRRRTILPSPCRGLRLLGRRIVELKELVPLVNTQIGSQICQAETGTDAVVDVTVRVGNFGSVGEAEVRGRRMSAWLHSQEMEVRGTHFCSCALSSGRTRHRMSLADLIQQVTRLETQSLETCLQPGRGRKDSICCWWSAGKSNVAV